MNIQDQRGGPNTYLVVLTATVTPNSGVKVVRASPALRQADYVKALQFWLNHPDPRLTKILFIENSGTSLDAFQTLAKHSNPYGKVVEFLSAQDSPIPAGMHYGYGELRMLRRGLEESSLASQCSHFIKATGRLTFPQISSLLDRLLPGLEIMVDCRIKTSRSLHRKFFDIILGSLTHRGAYASSQLILMSNRFYWAHLANIHNGMGPGEQVEQTLYGTLARVVPKTGIYLRFPINCDPSGVGAHWGTSYDTRTKKMIRAVRAVLRRLGIWI